MKFGATVLYVDHVQLVVDFYQRAFGLKLRFHDEQLGFAELDTGGPVIAIADHSLGEMLMPGAAVPSVGRWPARGCRDRFLDQRRPRCLCKGHLGRRITHRRGATDALGVRSSLCPRA